MNGAGDPTIVGFATRSSVNAGEMVEFKVARLVGGFARATTVKPEKYAAGVPDPVQQFSPMVCGHMNDDHGESIVQCVEYYTGLKVEDAKMESIDRLGINCRISLAGGDSMKCRLPFLSPAEDRKAVKDEIVKMSRGAAMGLAAAAGQ